MAKAREKQERHYNKKAAHDRITVGSKVLLDKRTVSEVESRKFVPRYEGIYRVIRRYDNHTADITNNSYKIKKVHLNRLKLVLEKDLWRDREFEKFDPNEEIVKRFHNYASTQTPDIFPQPKADDDHLAESESDEDQEAAEPPIPEDERPNAISGFDPINRTQFTIEELKTHQIPLKTSTDCVPQKIVEKKKRGRPKGSKNKSSAATPLHSSFRRTVGRPRLLTKPKKAAPKPVKQPDVIKRKVGRPKRNPAAASTFPAMETVQQQEETPRPKRGRPPKKQLVTETTSHTQPLEITTSSTKETNEMLNVPQAQSTTATRQSKRRVEMRAKNKAQSQ